MAKASLELKHSIDTMRAEYDNLMNKSHLTSADTARLAAMGEELDSLIPAFKAAKAQEDRSDAERTRMDSIFRGESSGPTHDGSRSMKHGSGFAAAILNAGFDLRSKPAVTIDLAEAYGVDMLASVDLSSTTPATYRPLRVADIQSLGRDSRFLWPYLPSLGVGEETSIEDFVQTGSRTITGTVERALAAVTEKATLDVAIDHVSTQLKTLAVLLDEIPNQVLRSLNGIEQFLSAEARFALDQALDAHVLAAILAANPPNAATGANIFEQVRYAIGAMRLLGSNPDLLVLNPTDSAALDLLQNANDEYYFGGPARSPGADTLWGLRVVEHTTTAGTQKPILIDSARMGMLYLGSMRFEADPFTLFSTNRTNLRMEGNALMHVRDANAAYVIEA